MSRVSETQLLVGAKLNSKTWCLRDSEHCVYDKYVESVHVIIHNSRDVSLHSKIAFMTVPIYVYLAHENDISPGKVASGCGYLEMVHGIGSKIFL